MRKALAGGGAAVLLALFGYAEIRIKAASSEASAAVAAAAAAKREALAVAAPTANASAAKVEICIARLDHLERLVWDIRSDQARLRSSVLVRRNSPEFRARVTDPPAHLDIDDLIGPPPTATPMPAQVEIPRIVVPDE